MHIPFHLCVGVQHDVHAIRFVTRRVLCHVLELRDPSGSVWSAFDRVRDEEKGIFAADSLPR